MESSTYRYLKMYLSSMNSLVMCPEVSKQLLTCTPAYSNPTPTVFPGDVRMFLTAKFKLWAISHFLSKKLSSCVLAKHQRIAPNLIQTGATMLQMQLHEFKLTKNKECTATFLNFFYTAWSYFCYCLKNRKY